MLLSELKPNILHGNILGSIYIESLLKSSKVKLFENQMKPIYKKLNNFKLEIPNGGFWLNPYSGDTLQGQLAHVEMIRQRPELFGLDSQGMPVGNAMEIDDDEYEQWLTKNDDPESKMKLGVFADGWVRGSFQIGEFFEMTGIPAAIKKLSPLLVNLITEIQPPEVGIDIFNGSDLKTNRFNLPDDLPKLKLFLGVE